MLLWKTTVRLRGRGRSVSAASGARRKRSGWMRCCLKQQEGASSWCQNCYLSLPCPREQTRLCLQNQYRKPLRCGALILPCTSFCEALHATNLNIFQSTFRSCIHEYVLIRSGTKPSTYACQRLSHNHNNKDTWNISPPYRLSIHQSS